MRRLLVAPLFLLLAGCGFLDKSRLTDAYFDVIPSLWPDNDAVELVTWPVLFAGHGTVLLGCATIDQGFRTFESVVPAGRDAYDYLIMPGNRNNVMLHQTIVVPKALATPVIFTGSYFVRWLLPFDEEERLF